MPRPYLVADIDFEEDPDLPLWSEFFGVCHDFKYREIMALSRAFGVHPSTVTSWKYLYHFPSRRGTALLIIGWVKKGKPMCKVLPTPTPTPTQARTPTLLRSRTRAQR